MRIGIITLPVFLFIASISTVLQAYIPHPARSFSSLPPQYREAKFQEVEKAFEERWNLFSKGKQFRNWTPNKSEQEILEEFNQINEWRYQAWYVDPTDSHLISKADYMVAQDLLEKGHYRSPCLIAFQYNRTDPIYNASSIVLNGLKFLALEGPKLELMRNFFTLLKNYQVTQLVRLTPSQEKGIEKSHPYWIGKVRTNSKTGENFLQIPQEKNKTPYSIRYYALNTWLDNQAVSPQTLLKLILNVRQHFDPAQGLLACHCAGGVGRTGTFLAGFLLMDEIDKQIAKGQTPSTLSISIEKIVMQLSLQRPYMVGVPSQYTTLYKLVDLYVKTLGSKQ